MLGEYWPKQDKKRIQPGGNPRLEAVKVGEVIHAPGTGKRHVVLPPCTNRHGGYWYCHTHGQGFDNQLQKDIHIHDEAVSHRLVWVCKVHGPEQPS